MKYFTFELFSKSDTATAKGIDNSVPANLRPHAEELIKNILDPLREAWGSEIYLTSAFRCEALNNAIGGSKTSAHSHAYAADLVPKNGNIREFKDFAMHWLYNNKVSFDLYINELKKNKNGGLTEWVHIGVRNGSGAQRKQYMLYEGWKSKGLQYTSINPNLYNSGEDVLDSTQTEPEITQSAYNAALPSSISSWNKSGLSDGGLNFICQYETGKKYGYTIPAKELNGYDLGDAGGHLTYGYGLLNHPSGKKMDDIKKTWSQSELEELYIITVSKVSDKIDSWAAKNGLTLTQNQKDAIASACYNFGNGFLTLSGKVYSETVNAIKLNPNNPMIKNLWEHISDIQGQKYPGLIRRRKAEADWYFNGGEGSYNGSAVPSSSIVANNDNSPWLISNQNTPSGINGTVNTGGGITLTGSTEGLIKGKSVYLNSINYAAIKSNGVFKKDENGNPIKDKNGEYVITDQYLTEGANEDVTDAINSIDELEAYLENFDMSGITMANTELVKGISYNADGSYVVKQSKTILQILAMVQEWWEMVQSLKRIDFKHIEESIKSVKDESSEIPSINAMVYMKAAFDMYGHAYREGMTCPVCGKKARYLPPGGYCSVECLLLAAKDKSLSFLMAPNDKYAWMQDVINQLCAILDLTNLLINSVVLIPDIIRELVSLPEEYKEYVRNKIAEGFTELLELIQKAMVKKNELLEKLLKPINFGIIAKPVAMAMSAIEVVRNALLVALDAFNMAFDVVKLVISKLSLPNVAPGLVLPAESFAWALTPRSFMSPMPYTCPDAGKIFVVLPGGSGAPIESLKPVLPSALLDLNMEAIDSTIQGLFPPLTPVDYYLEPELFEIRFLFSDLSDLVFLIRQLLEDLLRGGPDYLPKFENLLPIKMYTFGKGTDNEKEIPLPNMGYIWFLLGLMDAWAPHSQAMVGSMLNPAV